MTASPQNIDSLKKEHQNKVAAVQAFIELKFYKRIDSVNLRLLDFRESQVKALDHSLGYYKAAYEQCDGTTVPALKQNLLIKDEQLDLIKKQSKKDKARAFGKGFGVGMGVGVAIETAIILIVKFVIPKK